MPKFISLLPALLMFSCVNIKEVKLSGIKGFKLHKINTEGIHADVLLTVKNPNAFSFSIYKSEFDVLYNSVKLGKAKLNKRVKILANAEETYAFSLDGDFKEITLTDIMKVLEGVQRKGMLEVKGNLKAGRFFVKKVFPVEVKQKISAE